ncbi:Uncharacterized protein TCM_028207 [Theobroma cacao]|uniref:Uncharacterized protein n=1 Tax=Theobroma cacao TaxID=3641 RepID=A0A061GAM0_THECC|nr:Uncharacterized protein TCM_028207 [Theobroma cacao]
MTLGIRAAMENMRFEVETEGVASTPDTRETRSSRVMRKSISRDLFTMVETRLTHQEERVVELIDRCEESEAWMDGCKEQMAELREELQARLNETLEALTQLDARREAEA